MSLLSLVLIGCCSGLAAAETVDDVTALSQQMAEAIGELEFARYLARSALASEERADHQAYIEEIRVVLEGSTDDAGTSDGGLIGWLEERIRSSELTMLTRPSRRDESARLQDLTRMYLGLALDACEAASAKLTGRADPTGILQQLYAFLSVALGTPESGPTEPGLKALASLLPTQAVTVEPGNEIQAAIDSVSAGGAVFFEPGTYDAIALSITSDIWLAPIPGGEHQVWLKGTADGPVLRVASPEAAVELSELVIVEGQIGLRVEDASSCRLADCRFLRNARCGIFAMGRSVIVATDTIVRSNRNCGVLAEGRAQVSLVGCDISLNGSSEAESGDVGAGLVLKQQAEVGLLSCSLTGNQGYGIHAMELGVLRTSESSLSYNRLSGIHLRGSAMADVTNCLFGVNGRWDLSVHNADCLAEADEAWDPGEAFVGRLTGTANRSTGIPGNLRLCLGGLPPIDGFETDG